MAHPNPTKCDELATVERVERLQRLRCQYRVTVCLEIAIGWRGFQCSACGVNESMAPAIERAELDGLLQLGRVVARLADASSADLDRLADAYRLPRRHYRLPSCPRAARSGEVANPGAPGAGEPTGPQIEACSVVGGVA